MPRERDSLMSVEKLEQIESRIIKVMGVLAELKEKNSLLEGKVLELQGQLSSKEAAVSRANEQSLAIAKLTEENKRLIQERNIVSEKIEKILENLGEIEL